MLGVSGNIYGVINTKGSRKAFLIPCLVMVCSLPWTPARPLLFLGSEDFEPD